VLTVATQSQIESSDGGIAAHSRHRRHDTGAPDLGASSPDTRLPRSFPLSRLNGARPASAAICLRLSIPSSGNCASQRSREHFADPRNRTQQLVALHATGEYCEINSASSSSKQQVAFPTSGLCSSMLRCKTLGALVRRFLLRRQHLNQLAAPGNQCFERQGPVQWLTAVPRAEPFHQSAPVSRHPAGRSWPACQWHEQSPAPCLGLTMATASPACANACDSTCQTPVASRITSQPA